MVEIMSALCACRASFSKLAVVVYLIGSSTDAVVLVMKKND
jgi:hypothetical protein